MRLPVLDGARFLGHVLVKNALAPSEAANRVVVDNAVAGGRRRLSRERELLGGA